MNNVSLMKIRRLPYESRLNLIKHHPNMVAESLILIKEYPDRNHKEIEDALINKNLIAIKELLKLKNIDLINVTTGLGNYINEKLTRDDYDEFSKGDIFSNHKHNPALPQALYILTEALNKNINIGGVIELISISILKYLYSFHYEIMDEDKICDIILGKINRVTYLSFARSVFERTKSLDIRERIKTSMMIKDIIL